jgi:nucleoside 2-deoxyribosyltransferase
MFKAYVAARFSRGDELSGYRDELEKLGVEVTSRWLNGGHEWVGTVDEDIPVEQQAIFAKEDLEDIDAAEVFICFTESPSSPYARGGRHVEFGYALAKKMPIVVVGHRENVFYCLPYPQVAFVETWEEALVLLYEIGSQLTSITSQMDKALQALGFPAFAKE